MLLFKIVLGYSTIIGTYKGYMLHKDTTVSMFEYMDLGSEYTNALLKTCKYTKAKANWGWSKRLNEEQTVYTDDLGKQMYVTYSSTVGNNYIQIFIK